MNKVFGTLYSKRVFFPVREDTWHRRHAIYERVIKEDGKGLYLSYGPCKIRPKRKSRLIVGRVVLVDFDSMGVDGCRVRTNTIKEVWK